MLNSHKKNNIGFVRLLNRRKEPVNSEINWHPVKPWHRQVQWQSWNIGVPKKTTSKVVSSVQWCFRGGLSGGYETSFNFWCVFFLFDCLLVLNLCIASMAVFSVHKFKPLLCYSETSCFHLAGVQSVQSRFEWFWQGVTHVVFSGGTKPSKEAFTDRSCGYLQPSRSLAIPRALSTSLLGKVSLSASLLPGWCSVFPTRAKQ